jgi:hypothetical protein
VVSWEHGNEPSGAIKDLEFLGQLNDDYLLKKVRTAWKIVWYLRSVSALTAVEFITSSAQSVIISNM